MFGTGLKNERTVSSMVQRVPHPTITRGFCVSSDLPDGTYSLGWLQAQAFSTSMFFFPRRRLWERTGSPYRPARLSVSSSPSILTLPRRPAGMIHPHAVGQRGGQLTCGGRICCRSYGRYNYAIYEFRQVLLTSQVPWFSWESAPNLLAEAAQATAAAVAQHFSVTCAYAQRCIAEVTDVQTDVWKLYGHAQMTVCGGSSASDDPPPLGSIM
jgi:hypothetical protein